MIRLNAVILSGIDLSFFDSYTFRPKDQLETYNNLYQLDLLFPVLLRRRQDINDQLPLL